MATSTATAITTAPSVPGRNPKDDMKSTWRKGSKQEWGYFHKVIKTRGMYYASLDKPIPVHEKTDKVPYISEASVHRWILYHSAIPLIIQQAYTSYTGHTVHPIAMAVVYSLSFVLIGIHQLNVMRRLGHRYGFLDGHKPRDDVPDHSVAKTVLSLGATVTLRQVMAVILSYNRKQTPMQMDWLMLPLEIGLYGVVLDFWFYWYHRCMHQFDGLWQYHRTHHLTKHPTALLTLYADAEQEVFDMLGIPLITYVSLKAMGLPMGFYEWWICHNYVVWTELCGHSGLRVYINTPSTVTWLLKMFNCELVVEDHDLHHRMGWKKSHNYGKQTRLWDRIFGTCHERIESKPENVDYDNTGTWPIWI